QKIAATTTEIENVARRVQYQPKHSHLLITACQPLAHVEVFCPFRLLAVSVGACEVAKFPWVDLSKQVIDLQPLFARTKVVAQRTIGMNFGDRSQTARSVLQKPAQPVHIAVAGSDRVRIQLECL